MDDFDVRALRNAWGDLLLFAEDLWGDFVFWVSRLSDTEQLALIAIFILVLFVLILVNAANREKQPGNGRLFFMSVLMVGVFAFGVGWMLDTRFGVFNMI